MKFCCRGVRGSRVVAPTYDDIISIVSRVILNIGQDTFAKANSFSDLIKTIKHHMSPQQMHAIIGCGGNTPCVEIQLGENQSPIVFDMGSGVSNIKIGESVKEIHIFMSHFHYDHVLGMPFFDFLYRKGVEVNFYSPIKDFESTLRHVMQHPYFPITMKDKMTENMYFHELHDKTHIKIGDSRIMWKSVNHPGGSYAYLLESKGKRFCYFTDVNIGNDLFVDSSENKNFLSDIDVMILDASMSFTDSVFKRAWGHTSFYEGLNFAKRWEIKKVFLFHFEPTDDVMDTTINYQTALWYNNMLHSKCKVMLAQENLWVDI